MREREDSSPPGLWRLDVVAGRIRVLVDKRSNNADRAPQLIALLVAQPRREPPAQSLPKLGLLCEELSKRVDELASRDRAHGLHSAAAALLRVRAPSLRLFLLERELLVEVCEAGAVGLYEGVRRVEPEQVEDVENAGRVQCGGRQGGRRGRARFQGKVRGG